MMFRCPNCGQTVVVNGLGRKALNISVKNVYDTLILYRSVPAASKKLGCSRAYIYKTLKDAGFTVKEICKK